MMSPTEVIDVAFSTGEYVAVSAITEAAIAAAQQRYLLPLLGKELIEAIVRGDYEELREEYIAPTLGILTRIESQLAAYPPSATERSRAKLFLQNLTDYLNGASEEYAEYDAERNAMNRCKIVSGIVL